MKDFTLQQLEAEYKRAVNALNTLSVKKDEDIVLKLIEELRKEIESRTQKAA